MIKAEFVGTKIREAIDCSTFGGEETRLRRAIAWALLAIVQRLDVLIGGRNE